MFEFFDHTADLGLRVTAPDLNALFTEAALGLFSMMTDDLSDIRHSLSVPFDIVGTDRDYLLFDWLRELLMFADAHRVLFGRFDVSVKESGLSATAHGEPLDPARHRLAREVKAITYHGLKVEQTPSGWMAEVVMDI
ncbi:MAG: archease [Fimbriiglobus sp.]|jgi:SHS2 domain-containing protein|nr:archease [Fimbriiglobus sp.]